MQFFEAVKICFHKYFETYGRAGRKEYWYYQLFLFLLLVIVIAAELAVFYLTNIDAMALVRICIAVDVFLIVLLIMMNYTVTVRRFHDTDKNATFVLLYLIPVLGFLINLIILAQPGDECTNHYGPPPDGYVNKDNPTVTSQVQKEEPAEAAKEEIIIETNTESAPTAVNLPDSVGIKAGIKTEDSAADVSNTRKENKPPWKD